jgi:hypothetical protein
VLGERSEEADREYARCVVACGGAPADDARRTTLAQLDTEGFSVAAVEDEQLEQTMSACVGADVAASVAASVAARTAASVAAGVAAGAAGAGAGKPRGAAAADLHLSLNSQEPPNTAEWWVFVRDSYCIHVK